MTIRFSKGGKWYKLRDQVPGTSRYFTFSAYRNGVQNVWQNPIYDPATGSLNPGDGVQGMYFGGVLHPFLTLDNSGTRGAFPPGTPLGGSVPARHYRVNEQIIFKKLSSTQWVSEKTISEMDITVLSGPAPTGASGKIYATLTVFTDPPYHYATPGYLWFAEAADGMSIPGGGTVIDQGAERDYAYEGQDFLAKLIKVIA